MDKPRGCLPLAIGNALRRAFGVRIVPLAVTHGVVAGEPVETRETRQREVQRGDMLSRLAKAYLDHKADIGAPHATDQDILDHVDDITALMLGALGRAMAERRPRRTVEQTPA